MIGTPGHTPLYLGEGMVKNVGMMKSHRASLNPISKSKALAAKARGRVRESDRLLQKLSTVLISNTLNMREEPLNNLLNLPLHRGTYGHDQCVGSEKD